MERLGLTYSEDDWSAGALWRIVARQDRQHAGQGIGLAEVKDIIESYDATLTLEDSSLGGAAFRIHFPPIGQLEADEMADIRLIVCIRNLVGAGLLAMQATRFV